MLEQSSQKKKLISPVTQNKYCIIITNCNIFNKYITSFWKHQVQMLLKFFYKFFLNVREYSLPWFIQIIILEIENFHFTDCLCIKSFSFKIQIFKNYRNKCTVLVKQTKQFIMQGSYFTKGNLNMNRKMTQSILSNFIAKFSNVK